MRNKLEKSNQIRILKNQHKIRYLVLLVSDSMVECVKTLPQVKLYTYSQHYTDSAHSTIVNYNLTHVNLLNCNCPWITSQ